VSEENPHNVMIQNVVAVASLGQRIDLLAIVSAFVNVDYRPKRFPGFHIGCNYAS